MSRLPQVTAQELISFLRRQGFAERRQRGSHLLMVSADESRRATVPVHPGDLGRGTAAKILAGAGFTVDDYLRLR